MELVGLKQEQVQKLWSSLKPYFQEFENASMGKQSAETLRRGVIENDLQCWIAQEDGKIYACGLTEVLVMKTGSRWVHLGYLTGSDREKWQALSESMIESAKHQGFDGMTIHARPGWTPFVKTLGFSETHRIFEMRF